MFDTLSLPVIQRGPSSPLESSGDEAGYVLRGDDRRLVLVIGATRDTVLVSFIATVVAAIPLIVMATTQRPGGLLTVLGAISLFVTPALFFRWFLRHSLSALRPELYEIDLDAGRIRHRPRLGFGSEVPFDGIDAIEGITLRLGTRTRTRSGGKTTRHAFEATDIRLWPVLKGGAESLAVWPFGEDCARDRKDEAVSLATILSERLSLPPPTIEDFRRDRDEGGAPS